jgi:hypothetical protein
MAKGSAEVEGLPLERGEALVVVFPTRANLEIGNGQIFPP